MRRRTTGCSRQALLLLIVLLTVTANAFAETVITFAMRGGKSYADAVTAALEEFYKENPDIRVDLMPNYDRSKFRTAVVGGAPPDIYAEGAQYILSHAAAGLLRPLDDFIKASKMRMEIFVPPNVDIARWRNKIYAIPWTSDINFAFFKNTGLLQEAGYDASRPFNSIGELDGLCRRLLRVDGNGQLVIAPFIPWKAAATGNGLFTTALAFGGSFWDAQNEKLTTTNPRNIEALEWMVSIARRYHELGLWSSAIASSAAGPLAQQNKLVFAYAQPSLALGLRDKWPDVQFELGPIPHVEGQGSPNPVWVAGTELLIPVGSSHPEEAFRLIAFLTSDPKGSTLAATAGSLFPSNLRSPFHVNSMNDPIARVYYQQASAARFSRPPIPNQDSWTASLGKAVNDAIALNVSADEALMQADHAVRVDYEETLRVLSEQ